MAWCPFAPPTVCPLAPAFSPQLVDALYLGSTSENTHAQDIPALCLGQDAIDTIHHCQGGALHWERSANDLAQQAQAGKSMVVIVGRWG